MMVGSVLIDFELKVFMFWFWLFLKAFERFEWFDLMSSSVEIAI